MDPSATTWLYGRDRTSESLIGIGFAVIMSLLIPVPKPKEEEAPQKKMTGDENSRCLIEVSLI